jgi:hypothetical protein
MKDGSGWVSRTHGTVDLYKFNYEILNEMDGLRDLSV